MKLLFLSAGKAREAEALAKKIVAKLDGSATRVEKGAFKMKPENLLAEWGMLALTVAKCSDHAAVAELLAAVVGAASE